MDITINGDPGRGALVSMPGLAARLDTSESELGRLVPKVPRTFDKGVYWLPIDHSKVEQLLVRANLAGQALLTSPEAAIQLGVNRGVTSDAVRGANTLFETEFHEKLETKAFYSKSNTVKQARLLQVPGAAGRFGWRAGAPVAAGIAGAAGMIFVGTRAVKYAGDRVPIADRQNQRIGMLGSASVMAMVSAGAFQLATRTIDTPVPRAIPLPTTAAIRGVGFGGAVLGALAINAYVGSSSKEKLT